jgi:glycosyltransferase involved in cell wall biosynthesis
MSVGTPKLSLIIAVYNRPDFLERVFVSLLNQTFPDFEILVADDGSGPEIAEVIERYQAQFRHPNVHVWHEDDGFRKTIIVNRAATQGRADYLVFIDGDCILHHRFLERHYRRRLARQVLSGRRIMLSPELTERITLDDIRTRKIERPSYWWKHSKPHDRKNGIYIPLLFGMRGLFAARYQILGSNFSVHREDFFQINGYDERIVGRGLEDNNLCTRFLNSGISVRAISQEALQYHCHHSAHHLERSSEVIEEFRATGDTWTPHGIVKSEQPVREARTPDR